MHDFGNTRQQENFRESCQQATVFKDIDPWWSWKFNEVMTHKSLYETDILLRPLMSESGKPSMRNGLSGILSKKSTTDANTDVDDNWQQTKVNLYVSPHGGGRHKNALWGIYNA